MSVGDTVRPINELVSPKNSFRPYTLRKVDMDSVIVYQNTLHFEIRLLTIFLVLKLNKCVLQAIASASISDNFTREYLSKATKNKLQVLICIIGIRLCSAIFKHATIYNRE